MDLNKIYSSVELFNEVAGNLDNVTFSGLDLQLDLIFEEFQETVTALEDLDDAELLKESCDLFVVVSGFLQKLDRAGFKVQEALEKVVENNLSKFPITLSDTSVPGVVTSVVPKEACEIIRNQPCGVFVFKNLDGKIIKPTNFVGVNISDCVVHGFLEATR